MTLYPTGWIQTAQQIHATHIPLKVTCLCSVEMEKQLPREETENEWSMHKSVSIIRSYLYEYIPAYSYKSEVYFCREATYIIGATLSEPHTSGTALRKCVNIHACLLACSHIS